MAREQHRPLLVCDYDGNSRSGKGTIVEHLATTLPQNTGLELPRIRVEATGVYYRTIGRNLLDQGVLEAGLPLDEILARTAHLKSGDVLGILNDSPGDFLDRYPNGELYDADISSIVSLLSRSQTIRSQVRGGLGVRLETMAAQELDDETRPSMVLTDGRNLRQIIDGVSGAKLLLAHFITCEASEAAFRECMRKDIDPKSTEGQQILDNIRARNLADAKHPQNPGKPDDSAIEYVPRLEDRLLNEKDLRYIGARAARNSIQIHYDTTYSSKEFMVNAASLFVEGAMQTQNNYS
jgi:cytidylate kinase